MTHDDDADGEDTGDLLRRLADAADAGELAGIVLAYELEDGESSLVHSTPADARAVLAKLDAHLLDVAARANGEGN